MDDDANFCGGRLRLTAFLRIVEHNMPQRPTRFKRRWLLFADLTHGTTVSSPLGTANIAEISNASRNSESLEPGTGATSELTKYADAEVDIPIDLKHREGTNELRLATESTEQARKSAKLADMNTKESSGEAHRPSRTWKKRLPVNGLALLRTTTSDGLPEPSDAPKAFVAQVTALDHIYDYHLMSSVIKESHSSSQANRPAALKVVSSTGSGPRSYNSRSVRKSKVVASNLHHHPTTVKFRQHPSVYLQLMADGFVGSELSVVASKVQRRQGKSTQRETKPRFMAPGLALASGLLPTPVIQHGGPSAPSEYKSTKTLNSLPTKLDASFVEVADTSEQHNVIRAQGTTYGRQAQDQQAERWEHVVCSQLSSITAPTRRESESSGPYITIEG